MEIIYDKPFEVTEKQYNGLMNVFSGCVAGRTESGKFYIKVWLTRYSKEISQFLTKTP